MSVFPVNSTSKTPAGWAKQLKALGLGPLVAVFLQAGQPLSPLLAQIVYLAEPVASPWVSKETLQRLANQLEEPSYTSAQIQFLQGDPE